MTTSATASSAKRPEALLDDPPALVTKLYVNVSSASGSTLVTVPTKLPLAAFSFTDPVKVAPVGGALMMIVATRTAEADVPFSVARAVAVRVTSWLHPPAHRAPARQDGEQAMRGPLRRARHG